MNIEDAMNIEDKTISLTAMNIQVIYSIGVRCYTEMILKRMRLIKFSSIFGSLNIRNYDNVIKCLDSNFSVLFDVSKLIYTKNIPEMEHLNIKHGFRTLNSNFDDIHDYHSATIAHHDLSNNKDKQHFIRGLDRFEYIRDNKISILFINIAMEFDNTNQDPNLISAFKDYGFTKFRILSIFKSIVISQMVLLSESEYMLVYMIPSYGYNDEKDDKVIENIIQLHFKYDSLIDINYFPTTCSTKRLPEQN